MTVVARLFGQQEVRVAPQSSVCGEGWAKVKSGICTGNGAANGTTLVDTNGDSGGADTYNGKFVRMVSGTYIGLWARVVDDDGSGTLTLEGSGFPGQIDSGDEYEIWTCPDAVVVVDSSSGETNMVDAARTEANVNGAAFWVGYYAIPITGTHRGDAPVLVTGFVPGTGTFTLAAGFGSALAAGDVVLLRRFIEAEVDIKLTENYHPRPSNRHNFSVGDGCVGARGGSVSIKMDLRASGALAGADAACGMNDQSALLRACGADESVGSTCTVGAGSSTTAVKVATGDRENLQIGQMVVWNGNVTFITSLEDGGAGVDTVNVSPPLPGTPAATDLLYGTRMYAKSTSGDCYGCVIECEIDGVRHTLTGCKGTFSGVDGDPLKINFELSVDHWIRDTEGRPYEAAPYATNAPVLGTDRIAYLDTTAVNINGVTFGIGAKVTAKNVQGSAGINGRVGFQVTGYDCNMTFRELLAVSGDLDQDLRFQARTTKAVAVVWGSHENTVAVRVPVGRLRESPHPTNQDGLQAVPNVLECQDAGTALNSTTITKVPDWALHIS